MSELSIFGRKGGSSSSHTATEDPNTLQSNSVARIIDVISEGPCAGIVDGTKSIYLNSTPIVSSDGTVNARGVQVEQRFGLPSQSFVPGFPASENEIGVSVQIKQTTPLVRTVSNIEANACRITLATPQLLSTDKSSGDIHGSSVEIAIDVQPSGGAWHEARRDTISGKTTSTYQRSYRFELDGAGPWNIRVRRVTPDSTDSSIANAIEWSSYAEIVDGKFSYPDIAYAALKFDAQAFGGSIPSRSYDFKGLIISVPSNYNPETREYSGIWDGSFKQAWSDNPAWIFYDLLTNARYGMGLTDVDRYGLYTIAKYCDELVPDGYGGKEPRFTLNTVINSRQEAYAVLNQVAGAFRGMFYWAGDTITAVQDAPRPEDGARAFGPANVVDGKFSYTSSSDVARHTVANVTWNDPDQQYAQTVETVEDPESIQRYGWNQTDITAFGCSSRGQARRLGLWTLYTERDETQSVKFSVSIADADLRPGQVIAVSDPSFAGARLLGRIKDYDAGAMAVTLDQAPEKVEGQQWKITLRMPDGSTATRDCTLSGNVATLSKSLPEMPVDAAWWMLSSSKIGPQYYRVMSLSDNDDGTYAIDAIEHHPTKYEQVEQGIHLEDVPASLVPTGAIATPGPVTAKSYTSTSGTQLVQCMTISWERSSDARVQSYVVSVQGPNDSAFRDAGSTGTVSLDMRDVAPGEWRIRVRALDGFGQSSGWSSLVTTIGNMLMPVKPNRVDVQAGNRTMTLSAHSDAISAFNQEYEFWMSRAALGTTQITSNANLIGQGTSIAIVGLSADTTYFFYVRGINSHGLSDWYPLQAKTSNNFADEINAINADIKRPGGMFDQLINGAKSGAETAADQALKPLREEIEMGGKAFEDYKASTATDLAIQNLLIQLTQAHTAAGRAAVRTEQVTRITNDDALAKQVTAVTASLNDLSATVHEEMTAEVNKLNETVNAQWTISTETSNGKTAAVGLKNNGKTSEFGILANRFYLMSDVAGDWHTPFIIDSGKTFINSAMIKDASIDFAKINSSLQSDNYSPGRSGFKLDRNSGYFEAISGKFSGDVEAKSFRTSAHVDGNSCEITEHGIVIKENGQMILRLGVYV